MSSQELNMQPVGKCDDAEFHFSLDKSVTHPCVRGLMAFLSTGHRINRWQMTKKTDGFLKEKKNNKTCDGKKKYNFFNNLDNLGATSGW